MKKLSAFGIAFVLFIIVAFPASAAVIKTGNRYSLGAGEEVPGNLYISAGTAIIAGNVKGDLLAGGGMVTITGTVDEDILIGGGSIDVQGDIGGDVRIGGGSIVIGGNVGGDIVIGGGSVQILPGVTIGGDILTGSGSFVMEGNVAGNVTVGGGEIEINGPIAGNVKANASGKIKFGGKSAIKGDVVYSAPQKAEIMEGATVGGKVTFNEIQRPTDAGKRGLWGVLGALYVWKFLNLLVAGIVFVLLFSQSSVTICQRAITGFGRELVRGFIALIIIPIASIIMCATLIGFALGGIGLLIFLFLLALSRVYAGVVLGGLLSKWYSKQIQINWKWALLGIITLQLVCLIPYIGWIACFVIFLISLGSVSYFFYERLWLSRA